MLAQTQAGQCPRPPGLQSQAGPRDPAAIVTAGVSMALRQAGAHKFDKLHKLGRGRAPHLTSPWQGEERRGDWGKILPKPTLLP
jgi:hypothetical protein